MSSVWQRNGECSTFFPPVSLIYSLFSSLFLSTSLLFSFFISFSLYVSPVLFFISSHISLFHSFLHISIFFSSSLSLPLPLSIAPSFFPPDFSTLNPQPSGLSLVVKRDEKRSGDLILFNPTELTVTCAISIRLGQSLAQPEERHCK